MKFSKCLLPTVSRDSLRLSVIGDSRYNNFDLFIYSWLTAFAPHNNQTIYTYRVSAFSFYLKKKMPAKEKQTQGCAPRPRERRAAVLSSRLSISCSAHSHANAPELERMRARASCYASRSLTPLSWRIKHCGAAIESLIIRIGWVTCFYFAMA